MVREVKPTEEQILMLFQDRVFDKNLTSDNQPIAIIFAGVSGSGKSTLIKQCFEILGLNAFPIQADDYRRYHPKIVQYIEKYGRDEAHKKTGNFAHRCARGLLDKAINAKFNIVYETTFNNIETANELLDIFRLHNYRIFIFALPINVELSILRNQQRFEAKLSIDGTLPRIVEKETIIRMAENFQDCLEQIQQDKSIVLYQVENITSALTKLSEINSE